MNRICKERDSDIQVTPGQVVHSHCRRDFIHPRNSIHVPLINETDKSVTRSATEFDFQNACMFCGKHAKTNKRKRGVDVYPVRTLDFQESIKIKCHERNDTWSHEVLNRISLVLDLPAADAVYHQKCNVNFRTLRQLPRSYSDNVVTPPKKSAGRPGSVDITESFSQVISYVEDHAGKVLGLGQLLKVMEDSCGERAYSKKHLKKRLVEHFGENVLVSTAEGKEDMVCLRKALSKIVHDHSKDATISEQEKKTKTTQEAA